MINIKKCKQVYNKLLQRQKNAELYLDNKNISMDIIEHKYLPVYEDITRKLSVLLNVIGTYTNDEALNGFTIDKEV